MPIRTRISKPAKVYKPGKLDNFIQNISHPNLEASFIVINGKYIDISEDRASNSVGHDYRKVYDARYENKLEFIQKDKNLLVINHSQKIGHTHQGLENTNAMPSLSDIGSLIYSHLKFGTTMAVIVGRDFKNNNITGKTLIEIPKQTKASFKKKYAEMIDKQEWRIYWDNLRQLIKDQTRKDLLQKGIKITKENRDFNEVKNEFQKAYFQKLKMLFDLDIKIQEAPGYKFNKETLCFEKIKE